MRLGGGFFRLGLDDVLLVLGILGIFRRLFFRLLLRVGKISVRVCLGGGRGR